MHKNNKQCLLIFGMHRSGTSAFAGLLKQRGIPMGKMLMQGGYDNPKGFYENKKAVEINEKILNTLGQSWDSTIALPENWTTLEPINNIKKEIKSFINKEFKGINLFALKDPRFSLTLPLWAIVLKELSIELRQYILVRHPYEVADSLLKRNHFSRQKTIALWMKYMFSAELVSRAYYRKFISFPSILENPISLIKSLDININSSFSQLEKKANSFINSDLRHHHADQLIAEPILKKINEIIQNFTIKKEEKETLLTLDTLRNSEEVKVIIPPEDIIASLAIDFGNGFNEIQPLAKIVSQGTKRLVFQFNFKNGQIPKGFQFYPANTLVSLQLDSFTLIASNNQVIEIKKIRKETLLEHDDWFIFNKQGFITIQLHQNAFLPEYFIIDLRYNKFGDFAQQDIKNISTQIQEWYENKIKKITINSLNEINGVGVKNDNLMIPQLKQEVMEVEKEPLFWVGFLKTGFKYPASFFKNINTENFRILKRALANESPSLILRNLKNLLLSEKSKFEVGNGLIRKNAPQWKNLTIPLPQRESIPKEKLGNILYISPNLPDYDASSGGKRATRILELLVEAFDVSIFTLGRKPQKYIEGLKNRGVRVLETTNYGKVKRKIPSFKAIIYSVHYTFRESNKFVKLYPTAKIILDTVDVHWVREERSIGIWEGLTPEKVQENKVNEIAAYKNADVIWAVTEQDKKAILKEISSADIRVVSNVHKPIFTKYEDNGTNTILFIGSYNHYPNISAVKFLALDIFPKVRAEIKDAQLIIAGANAPEEVVNLGNLPGIIFKGFVEEEEMDDLYKNTFLSVSPLLIGSGIKGKICEAIAYRTPVVTNAIGNEGIDLVHEKEGLITALENMPRVLIKAMQRGYDFSEMTTNAQHKLFKLVGPKVVKHHIINSIFEEISICIVTWNRLELLKRCIASIQDNTTYPNYKILVHSNACTDGTQSWLKAAAKINKNIIPIFSKENQVFVLPNNKMMQLLPENDVVLVNNDVYVTKNWLLELYKTAYSSDEFGIVGSKILYPDGRLQEFGSELYANGTGCNIGKWDNPNQKKYEKLKEVGYVSGCAMYIKRSTIKKIGAFDEQFHPCYFEDSDYCYTAKEHGIKTVVTPDSLVYHEEGATAGTDTGAGFKQYQEINREKFLQKHFGKKNKIKWGRKIIKNPPQKENRLEVKENKAIKFIDNYESYIEYRETMVETYKVRGQLEKKIANNSRANSTYKGINPMLDSMEEVGFEVFIPKNGKINLRESFICPKTFINSRLRGAYVVIEHFLEELKDKNGAAIYFTEETTPFYKFYKQKRNNLIGSEYLGDTIPLGAINKIGLRNEDLTRLTFEDFSFDMIVCLEVLEHIPDYEKALQEVYRVLKPGGIFIFSVPFILGNKNTTIRAEVKLDGTLNHLLPPEYHGNPTKSGEGILCFYHFGWELLDKIMTNIGFKTGACLTWSEQYAIFGNAGNEVALFYGRK